MAMTLRHFPVQVNSIIGLISACFTDRLGIIHYFGSHNLFLPGAHSFKDLGEIKTDKLNSLDGAYHESVTSSLLE